MTQPGRSRGRAAVAVLSLVLVSGGCTAVSAEPRASDCPALLPGTSNALDDYVDLVVWDQRTYVANRELPDPDMLRPHVERRLARIGCNVGEWSDRNGGRSAAPVPWPDGTATGLAVGTPIYQLVAVRAECGLGVREDKGIRVFVARDLDPDDPPAPCS